MRPVGCSRRCLRTASSCSNSVVPGVLTYTNGGTSTTGYLIQAGGSNSWGTVTPSSSQVTIGLGPRFYLANSCATAFSSTVFQKFNLLGSTITFTVNLATVGCGTDASFYLTGMPAAGAGSNGDYYCDSNCVGGSCCAEMDLIEANRHALQITAHHCSSATSGCDSGGCAINSKTVSNGYGPASTYTINTLNPFTVAITFGTSGGQLSTITSVISQGSKSFTLTHSSSNCGSGYLAELTAPFQTGMVVVWSFWSGSMLWLDSPACSSDTNEESNSQMIFSNLVITSAGAVAPPPPPPPPPPPGTLSCGDSSCTINDYWVEFTAPTGASSPSTATATVSCTLASGSKSTISCTWFASASKYQCNPSPNECLNPIPYFNGVVCPYPTPQADGTDTNTMGNNLSLDGATIAGIVVGCVVVVTILILAIVLVLKKKQREEYV